MSRERRGGLRLRRCCPPRGILVPLARLSQRRVVFVYRVGAGEKSLGTNTGPPSILPTPIETSSPPSPSSSESKRRQHIRTLHSSSDGIQPHNTSLELRTTTMSESSITVTVRIRPFSEKEAAQLAPQAGPLPFLGDGGLGGSPAKPLGGAPGLRTRFLRPIISPVDDKVLIFDPPDNNPLSRLYNHAHANYMSHGQKRVGTRLVSFAKHEPLD